MRTRILLLGSGSAVINDFFRNMDEVFEMQTTSMRYDDIICHLKYFNPSGLVCCLSNESYDDISRMVSVKQKMDKLHKPFIIAGDSENCEDFTKIAINVADLIIQKPFSTSTLQNRVESFLKNWAERFPQGEEMSSPDVFDSEEETDEANEAAAIAAEINKKLEEKASEDPNRRKHILIIDDDPLMQRSIKAHLTGKYTVGAAISGAVALRFLETKSTDLILLDYEMPGEKGPDVLAKLRANPKTADIPVVFLTGASERKKIATALSMKPQGYMLKPIQRDDLLDKVKELIGE